ncbi:MAG: D-xylose 1-dehydrogenase D-xylono,5-lactone-forming, partial [Gaiellales bacterium]|nr:D-xylose 1-dehydrogenase D-xylono,5-lactone-forming [Gaiellales bacterium]
MANAVKWGIISTADINRKVIPGAHASPKVELVAVASRDQARAEEYAKTWEIERAYGSYDALLADAEIEAVYISLPNTMHCEWSIKALEAGKHVLCEKPLSRHPEEVEAAFDAADRTGRLLSEAF